MVPYVARYTSICLHYNRLNQSVCLPIDLPVDNTDLLWWQLPVMWHCWQQLPVMWQLNDRPQVSACQQMCQLTHKCINSLYACINSPPCHSQLSKSHTSTVQVTSVSTKEFSNWLLMCITAWVTASLSCYRLTVTLLCPEYPVNASSATDLYCCRQCLVEPINLFN